MAQAAENDGLAVDAENLSKDYYLGDVVVHGLRDADLQLPTGTFVVVLGPSGSGKTTLLNLVGGLDMATSGRLEVFGESLTDMDERRLTEFRRTTVGFVFQMFNLVPTLTALENVKLIEQLVGGEGYSQQVLAEVGLDEFAQHLPSQLSGGQQQRVAIARALVKRPNLLLADEPTGALDYTTGCEVLALLWEETRNRDMTAIMVTHDTSLGRMGDMIVNLSDRTIAEVVEREAVNPRELIE